MEISRKYLVDIVGEKISKDKITKTLLYIFFAIFIVVIFIPMCFWPDYYTEMDFYTIATYPCKSHPFGTDHLGRDVFIRVCEGGRVTLGIALITTIISVFIGTIYGTIAGYFGKKIDIIMMGIVDVLYSIPFLFFAILLMTIFGNNHKLLFVAIACVSWLDVAKIVRAQTMTLKNKDFINAAKVTGEKDMKIIFSHIIRNVIGYVFIYTSLTIPNILSLTAFLGFLGFGMQPPMIGWGELIAEGAKYLSAGYWWMLIFPALFLILSLLTVYYLNKNVKEALEIRDSNSRYIM